MQVYFQSTLISLLVGNSFLAQAADSNYSDLERAMAASLGMNVPRYRKHLAEQQNLEVARQLQEEENKRGHLRIKKNDDDEKATLELISRLQLEDQMKSRQEEEKRKVQIRLQEKEKNEKASLEYARRLQFEDQIRIRQEEERRKAQIRMREKEENEKTSLEHARRLQAEEDMRKRREDEEASLAYIRQLQEQEQSKYQAPSSSSSTKHTSLIIQANNKSREIQAGPNKLHLDNFMRIFNYLSTTAQNSDVHVLDTYVWGSGKNIQSLLQLSALYQIDNANLTLAEVGKQMVTFVQNNPLIFSNYTYVGTPVTSESIISYLNSHFSSMDTEIQAYCPEAREVWSRAWTLALKLYNEYKKPEYMQIIFDQALEGHLTRGGCIQGRINRGFVGYVILLGKAGVGIHG